MSDVIELCKKLINFPSTKGNTEPAFLFLKDFLNQTGFHTRLLNFENSKKENALGLCATFGQGHPHLVFIGHIDVVDEGDITKWKHPPFDATIDNDILYGRGIADMKGGVACFIEACSDFIKNHKFDGKITILLSGDEEEPIVESTNQLLKTLHKEGEVFDFGLVGEPSNPKTLGDEIKIGRRGDIVFHITSLGTSGHTAYAPFSTNPIHNLINLLYNIQNDKLDDGNAYFAPSSFHITTIDVKNLATNVVPQSAHATIDVRFNSEHTYDSINSWLKKHIDNTTGKFEVKTEYIGESFLSPLNEHIDSLKEIIKQHTGQYPTYSTAGGTSDARFVKNYCPVIEYGLTNNSIHKTNEYEKVANIELLHKIYQDFLSYFFK